MNIFSEQKKLHLLQPGIFFDFQTENVQENHSAIQTLLEIDFKKQSLNYYLIFPTFDIGTPKRILKWLLENKEQIKQYQIDNLLMKDLNQLINFCEGFSNKGETLEHMAETLKKEFSFPAKEKDK